MNIKHLEEKLLAIYDNIIEYEPLAKKIATNSHPAHKLSAMNLLGYLVLRAHDLRKLHDALSDHGISSLRTCEGYVHSNLYNVIKLVKMLQGKKWEDKHQINRLKYSKSKKLIRTRARRLFNPGSRTNFTEIMVTLPTEAAENKKLIKRLVKGGMEIARINLSHDNMKIWKKMISNIKAVRKETKRDVKIYMDLAGPKIRTSEIKVRNTKGEVKNNLRLAAGDYLVLTKKKTLGKKVKVKVGDKEINVARVGVLLPQIIDDIKIGDEVYFDDGMIKGIVKAKSKTNAELLITAAYKAKLSSNKGINLPNTSLNLPSLTNKDLELLPFVSKNADIVGYSFVRTPRDVRMLYKELEKLGDHSTGVVFKIETKDAFENLPLILFQGMKREHIGVMIARGDLAVEIGFERISEVQSEILWFCEAAHVPVIWATQVLETLAKKGKATRAEITDAAHSAQAECVMLNKGPYIVDAVRTLKNVLMKMERHGFKKKDQMRGLHTAEYALAKLKRLKKSKKIVS
ncbi:MAG: pyruvate kinase [Bacteroidia bacterium]|nr:pyruvate kinase [Bacteroidia bacterium]